jgi:N,N-dimethylformamidase
MEIVGYADRLRIAPGERLRVMVSTPSERFRAQLVRLGAGPERPHGPGYGERPLASGLADRYAGGEQRIPLGSFVRVAGLPPQRADDALTLGSWVYATAPGGAPQALLARLDDEAAAGFALLLDEQGVPELRLRLAGGGVARLRASQPLAARSWALVAASLDGAALSASLHVAPALAAPLAAAAEHVGAQLEARPQPAAGDLLLAACGGPPALHLNGKLDGPFLLAGAASERQLAALAGGSDPAALGLPPIAVWDLGRDFCSAHVSDASGNGHHGRCINLPMRAVTGRRFTGRHVDYAYAPAEWSAIHFHDDDLDDAGWRESLALDVPAGLESGVYAIRLESDAGGVDHVPFAVTPPRGRATASIALLLPTLSYLAYANEHASWKHPIPSTPGVEAMLARVGETDRYAAEQRLLSIYELHSDGSGTAYSSYLRPIVNMRPGYDMPLLAGPHQFPADLELEAWLDAGGFRHDVVTDEDLDAEGVELLRRYRVVLTGSHPEYTTLRMLDALGEYLGTGGRLLYLGGNGFYWVTSLHPEAPHALEVRRGHAGTRVWASEPAELHHASTGEAGGLWRHRGRPPQALVGVGFAAQGFDASLPYRLAPAARDPRVDFAFDGVPREGEIGGYGSVLGGAGGFEVDRADHGLGTPPHALVLGTATGFSDVYQGVVEEILTADSQQGGTIDPDVRADLVFYEGPAGGAVFSVGSISWCGALNHARGDNDVSRLTANVLRRFDDPAPFAVPQAGA